ncbi:hypothetical protein CSB09_01400 [Candidatus Gracilibacteria bacterium]|nr:MAG: hypothetical protein CSB09_01400 [Candidatus Gracilibacteria bacterium]
MIDLQELQKKIYQNKLDKGFNTKDIHLEFNYIYGELSEAFDAYLKEKGNVGEELADVAIYLLGLSEILGVNLETEILEKMKINKARKYKKEGGGHTKI